ncbi:hypothetical protein ABPG77_011520 [Micractinium sp. CCAP 211/92]
MADAPHKEEEWEMVEREEEPTPEDKEEPSFEQPRNEADEPQRKHELIYCLLCCLDAAVELGVAASKVARRVCATGAELVCKAEQALAPAAASIRGASVLYAGLLRRGDVRGAARLAAGHTLRQHAAGLRQRTVATARASYEALDPERRLAALATGSQRLPAATCLMLAGGAGLLATAAVLTVHIVWD